jgi:Zn-dependent protease with chaperone function
MTFRRHGLMSFCFAALLVCLAPAFCRAQETPAQTATAQAAPATTQAYSLPPDKLAKAIAINRIRNIMDIVYGLWGIGVIWLLLATRTAARIEAWTHRVSPHRWLQGFIFFAVLLILITLANLPLDLYGHSVSRSYGISIQGWGGWLGDQAKALGVTVLLATPVLLLFNWIVRRWPRRYWLGIWLVTLPLLIVSLLVAPLFEPIFNKYEPLTLNHAALVDKLETVVARTGTEIPPDRMFLMKASLKTNGLNAYVNGIGATKRIVVWDTTAGRIPDDEVMFIFGHESGHYILNHIPKQLAGLAIALFFVYWGCAAFSAWLARRFGDSWLLQGHDVATAQLSTRAGFVILIFAITLAGFVLEPVGNTFSRHFEHEADVYGQEAIHGLVPDPQKTAVAGFQALGEAWLEDPNPSPLIEFWEYNHPSVKTRANFAAKYDPWANGGHGEFFDK